MDWLERFSANARKGSEAELTARTQALKKQFLKNMESINRLKDGGSKALPGAVIASMNMAGLVWSEMIPVARHPKTTDSPLGPEIDAAIKEMHKSFQDVMQAAPRSLPAIDQAEILAPTLELFEVLNKIIVEQLSLVHRPETHDYFRGLSEEAPFPSFRFSAANRGRVPEFFRPEPDVSSFKATKIGALIWPSCIVGPGGDIYIGHADGEFVALHPDGSVKWRLRDERVMYIAATGAFGADGFLYMASNDCDEDGNRNRGRVWKIDPETGEVLWTFSGLHYETPSKDPHAQLSSFFEGGLAINEEGGKLYIYAGSNDNRLYKIDTDGNLVWEYDTNSYPSGVIWTKPLISPDGGTVYIGTLSGGLHAVEASSGLRRWMTRVGGAIASTPAWGQYGEIFFGAFDGKLYALAPEDGTIFWSHQTLGLIHSSPAVTEDGSVVVGSCDGGIHCVDRFGKKRWTYYTDGPVKSSPAIDPEGLIYAGNENGKLYCISPEGRRVWSLLTAPGPANDLNSSPAIDADGTIHVGSTTGEIFSVSRNFYFDNHADERVCIEPGNDGARPDIPPGGAVLVPLDRFGTPRFSPPFGIEITENISLALLAADADLNIVAAEIDPRTVAVEITPETGYTCRIDPMGRGINIIPSGLLEGGAEYTVSASGRYIAGGEAGVFDRTITFTTAPCGEVLPLSISEAETPGIVIKGFQLSRPKEIDALAQAAIDAHNFAIAPIHIDRERGIIVLTGWSVLEAGGSFQLSPRTANRFLASGVFRGGCFKTSGSFRMSTLGANIPFDLFRLSGRFTSARSVENGAAYACTSIHNMPEYADLLRVMRVADERDELAAFLAFDTVPYDNPAFRRPEGLEIQIETGFDRISARVTAGEYKAEDHLIQFILLDIVTGEIIGGSREDVVTGESGILTEIHATIPREAQKNSCAAILVLDFYPFANIRFSQY